MLIPVTFQIPDPLQVLAALATVDPLPPFTGRKPLASDVRNLTVLTTKERRIQRWAEETLMPTIQGLDEYTRAVNQQHQDVFHPGGGDTTDPAACLEHRTTLHMLSCVRHELMMLHAEKYAEMWNSILGRHPELDPHSIEFVGDGQLVEVVPQLPAMHGMDPFTIALLKLRQMMAAGWFGFDDDWPNDPRPDN